VEFATQKLAESVAMGDNYPEHYLDLGRAYDLLAGIHPDQAVQYHDKAQVVYQQALSIFPQDQSLLFADMINLSYEGKIDEAIKVAQAALAEDERVPESHYYLGEILFLKDNVSNATVSLDDMEYSLNQGVNPLPVLTKAAYEKMLALFYKESDMPHLVTVLNRLVLINPDEAPTYQKVLEYIKQTNQIPILNLQ
jgi:tetratricopeptide (TPR) repeat protein